MISSNTFALVESLEERRFMSVSVHYSKTDLVSDGTGAAQQDTHLKNPWGLAFDGAGDWWISNNATNTSTLYDGSGNIISLVVNTPTAPTGIVSNSGSGFKVSKNGSTGASEFIFATESGKILGWNFSVDAGNAIIVADRSARGAVYKGLAIGAVGSNQFLYAANFRSGAIDVFNKSFKLTTLAGKFKDPLVPRGFSPFNVQNLNGKLYVTYAKADLLGRDDIAGKGNGFVSVFNTSGKLIKHLIAKGALNSPWGVAIAPKNFGKFSGALLVGNFGDGKINAFNATSGKLLGKLTDTSNKAIVIPGLWGLAFGNGASAGAKNSLFFTAGPNAEENGLFGRIRIA